MTPDRMGGYMENRLDQTTEKIIQIVRESEMFQAYVFHKERLMKQPALYQELSVFRREAHELSEAPESEIMDRTDAFRTKYAAFLENPLVDDFLSSEMALVRAVQKISVSVINELGIGMTEPGNVTDNGGV